jgi:hypothetical protein
VANPNTVINTFSANIVQFVALVQTLRTQNDQMEQDPSIVTDYFAQVPGGGFGPGPRTDIDAADVAAAQAALVQVLFAFDSGTPPLKAALYKMQP